MAVILKALVNFSDPATACADAPVQLFASPADFLHNAYQRTMHSRRLQGPHDDGESVAFLAEAILHRHDKIVEEDRHGSQIWYVTSPITVDYGNIPVLEIISREPDRDIPESIRRLATLGWEDNGN